MDVHIIEHRRFPAPLVQKTRQVSPEGVRLKPGQVVDDRYTGRRVRAAAPLAAGCALSAPSGDMIHPPPVTKPPLGS